MALSSCTTASLLETATDDAKNTVEDVIVKETFSPETKNEEPTVTKEQVSAPANYISDNVFTKALKDKEREPCVFKGAFSIEIAGEAFLENVWILKCSASHDGKSTALLPTVQIKLVSESGSVLYYAPPYEIGAFGEYVTREWRVPPIRGNYDRVKLEFAIPPGVSLYISDMINMENVASTRDDGEVRYHAHQGFSGYTAASTADSFEQAGILGYESCITIPKFTKDGVGVCFHDDDTIRKKMRYSDGSTIPAGSADDRKVSEFTYEELLQFDMGVKKSKLYAGQKIATLDEFFRICAKYDMDPIFSVHPDLTRDQWLYVKDLLVKHGLLHKFWVKTGRPSTQRITAEVFDDDIAGYIMIQGQSSTWDPLTQAKSCGFDLNRHKVIMEYFYAAITPEKILTAKTEGFKISVATTGEGISGKEIRRLQSLGVTEFTIDHHCSMNLNW